MTRKRLSTDLKETRAAIELERAELERLKLTRGAGQAALDAANSQTPLVESIVGFLVGKREQNGFGRDYRITAITRSDERHA